LQCVMVLENDSAPSFSVTDYRGNSVDLESFRGKRVLISFLRGASCPFCNMRIRELTLRNHELAAQGIGIIVFLNARKAEIERYAGKENPPFAIIPDPSNTHYKNYGVQQSHLGMLRAMVQPLKMVRMMRSGFFNLKAVVDPPIIPADFIVGPTGIIEHAYYGNDFGDHMNLDEYLNSNQ